MGYLDTYQSSSISIDELDRKIIDLLKADGRITYKDISTRLDIPEATARYRVQRLLHAEFIQIQAWPNPKCFGVPHAAILHLFVENGWVNQVADQLSHLEEVQFVAITAGRHNIVVDVNFGKHEELLAFFDKLASMSGIIRYETQIILRLLKAKYQYTLN
ncbi:MAG: AsnC family transcriptional regulator [Cyanobacteria bacterium REEB459]|nr:AsnC family transcriptional regulator [Cyanobacteria bacterium REEB459]